MKTKILFASLIMSLISFSAFAEDNDPNVLRCTNQNSAVVIYGKYSDNKEYILRMFAFNTSQKEVHITGKDYDDDTVDETIPYTDANFPAKLYGYCGVVAQAWTVGEKDDDVYAYERATGILSNNMAWVGRNGFNHEVRWLADHIFSWYQENKKIAVPSTAKR